MSCHWIFTAVGLVAFLLLRCLTAGNKLSFANYYGSYMVLQQAPAKATVWGTGSVGDHLTLTVTMAQGQNKSMQIYKTTVEEGLYPDVSTKGGVWRVLLNAMPAGGPYSIEVRGSSELIDIHDVMFGDVWLCAGQSNMEFTMSMVFNASEEIATAGNFPDVRVFTLKPQSGMIPHTDVIEVEQSWTMSSKATIGGPDWKYFSAVCWLFGRYLYKRLNYPIGLIASTWGGTPIERWSSPAVLKSCSILHEEHDSEIWNAMIFPLYNMTIKGAIWYQGESNTDKPDSYNCSFPAMISDWRAGFNKGSSRQTQQLLPFGFVQLAPYRPPPDGDSPRGFPDIRWHQTADMGVAPNPKLPNVFMSVAVDLPDYKSPYGSIHPRDKLDASERLGLAAMGVAYGQNVDYTPLMPSAFYVDLVWCNMTIEFDKGQRALDVRRVTTGFEICCSTQNTTYCPDGDAHWVPAKITNSTNTSVTILYKDTCDQKWVVGLRYLWKESPCTFKNCPLYGAASQLPVPPFKMDGIFNNGLK